MKILKARQLARLLDDTTQERLETLAAELEKQLREIDEQDRRYGSTAMLQAMQRKSGLYSV